jgi:hypothetical protein
VYGIPADEDVGDVEWLARAGDAGWAVLMKDERIRYRPPERRALVAHGVQAFCLTSGSLRAAAMAGLFLDSIDAITDACRIPGPFLYAVSANGLRSLDLG